MTGWPRVGLRQNLLPIVCGLVGLALNGVVAVANSGGGVDFNQYYSAGKLVGTGHLYDWDAIRSLELERPVTAVPFGRIPAFAIAFKPLSALPWSVARVLWLCIGIAALAGFVYLWPLTSRVWACVAICWSAPVAMCLSTGQDTILFLFFMSAGLRLLMRGHDFWAGIVFSACIAKPHLTLLLPVFLIARMKWSALLGGIAGGAASVLLSFAVEGKDWLSRLFALARRPEFDPAALRMPNLRGLLYFLGGGLALEVSLGLAIAATIWWLSRRESIPTMGALLLACGLAISHHAYFYDALLLLPALLLPLQSHYPEWLRNWAVFLATPIAYSLLLTSAGLPGELAITGFTLALLVVTVRFRPAAGLLQGEMARQGA